jgi:hypothetical protein
MWVTSRPDLRSGLASRRAPTWALLVGVGLLDILFGPFVLAGIERATVTPSVSPGFSLDCVDWSHSLVMSLVWSVLFAAAFARYGRRVMMAIGFAVFSHFLLDLPVHPPDLTLWPNSASHLGSASGGCSRMAGGSSTLRSS